MNAQRSVWSPQLSLPTRHALYAGGYFHVDSRLVHLWFCDDRMQRVVYKEASVPDTVLQAISYEARGRRYYAPLYRAVGCTQDGLFLFAALVHERLDDNSFLDRLYYVVVNKQASEWRAGSVSLSQFRPLSVTSYDIYITDAGRWLWDGRLITCLLYVHDRTNTSTLEYVTSCIPGRYPKYTVTNDEHFNAFIVQIDTYNESIIDTSPVLTPGNKYFEEIAVRSGTLYFSQTITEDHSDRPLFVSRTTWLYSTRSRRFRFVDDTCTNVRVCNDNQRNALVYAGEDVLVVDEDVTASGLCDRLAFAPYFETVDAVVEHGTRPGAYAAYRIEQLRKWPDWDAKNLTELIIGCGTRIINRIPVERLTGIGEIGAREYIAHLTTIGASDDAALWAPPRLVGATDDTLSVFINGPSRRMVEEGTYYEEGLTTWWLLTISLDTGRVVREVKLEPVDDRSPVWEVEAGGTTHAMPMVSVLGGGQFRL
jgi:hypothetical protein